MGSLCIIYAFFLCCIITPVIAAIILFLVWFSFYCGLHVKHTKNTCISNRVKSSFFRVIHIIKTENIKFPLCFGLFLSLFFVFLYFYFENNLLIIKLKEARLFFANCIVTEFKYFGAVSTLASSILSVLFLFRFIYKKEFFVLYNSLNTDEQGLALVILICLFLSLLLGVF